MSTNQTQSCKHCDSRPAKTHDGYCGKCQRKATIIFSQQSSGEYSCSLCILQGNHTTVPLDEQHEHVEEEHGFEWGDKKATIKATERAIAQQNREESQQTLKVS